MAIQMLSVADLRARLAEVLEKLSTSAGPVYLTQRGQARAVLLAVDEYERLTDQLEYLEDSLTIAEGRLRDTQDARPRSLEEVERDLRRRGRLPR